MKCSEKENGAQVMRRFVKSDDGLSLHLMEGNDIKEAYIKELSVVLVDSGDGLSRILYIGRKEWVERKCSVSRPHGWGA